MNVSVIDLVWDQLQDEIQRVREQAQIALTRSERAETAGGAVAVLYAALPRAVDGAGAGDLLFVTNARKVGEGAGAGTGTLCYYDSATDTWFSAASDTAVAI